MHGMGNLKSLFFSLSLMQCCEMHTICMDTIFIPPEVRTVNDEGLHPNGCARLSLSSSQNQNKKHGFCRHDDINGVT
jgi:hypothetical protein